MLVQPASMRLVLQASTIRIMRRLAKGEKRTRRFQPPRPPRLLHRPPKKTRRACGACRARTERRSTEQARGLGDRHGLKERALCCGAMLSLKPPGRALGLRRQCSSSHHRKHQPGNAAHTEVDTDDGADSP